MNNIEPSVSSFVAEIVATRSRVLTSLPTMANRCETAVILVQRLKTPLSVVHFIKTQSRETYLVLESISQKSISITNARKCGTSLTCMSLTVIYGHINSS